MNHQLYIYDCLSEKLRASESNFMTLGSGEKTVFRLAMNVANAGSFAQRDGNCHFFPHNKVKSYSINGVRMSGDVLIERDTLYLLVLAGGCFICWYGDSASRPDFSELNPKVWYIHNASQQEWRGPVKLEEIPPLASNLAKDTLVTFHGLDSYAFYLVDILEVAAFHATQLKGEEVQAAEAEKNRYLRCPCCWEQFTKEHILSIAAHPDLCGDDYLDEDAQQRFVPEYINENGLPLDAMGLACVDYACPHCHHKLPPFFTQTKQHIISLVGVAAAGKSYYLSSLIHELSTELPREFNIPFRDADPISNAALNDMSLRLFSGRSPQETYIGKTRLTGSLYRRVWRHQHFCNIPNPFIYNINKGEDSYSLVLFDNAGESFNPGHMGEDHPEAEHLHIASAITYLFDPSTNPGFRSLLRDNKDPQMQRCLHPSGRQGLLIAETEMRLRTRLNIPPGKKIDIPLALMIGKCDIWQHLLGPEPLLPIVRNGVYMPEHVKINSARLRQFLFEISPSICTNAEAISENVRYFAVSSFGCSPVEFVDPTTGSTMLGPDAGSVKPLRVCDPIIWALSNIEPSLFPTATSS